MSLNLQSPELYEQCGTCAGTRTVTEISVHGTPVRKSCPKCFGSGTIPKSAYRHPGRDSTEDDELIEPEKDLNEDPTQKRASDPFEDFLRVEPEIEATQSSLEAQLMNAEGLDEGYRLDLWARLHAIDPGQPESDGRLELLVAEFKALGMEEFAHRLQLLAYRYVDLKAIQLRLKSR
jgi:hypothetical protein